jgi:leucyl-tRNA synthetase
VFPKADESLLVESSTIAVVQVNGKLRDKFEVSVDISKEDLIAKALESEVVTRAIGDGEIVQQIASPPKFVNFVVK